MTFNAQFSIFQLLKFVYFTRIRNRERATILRAWISCVTTLRESYDHQREFIESRETTESSTQKGDA